MLCLVKETFPNQEFLGFYITGSNLETNEQDVLIQKLALKYNGAAYLLKFNAETPVITDKVRFFNIFGVFLINQVIFT